MATTNYNIDYEDPRFKEVETQKQAALDQMNNTYNDMVGQTDQYYQEQINASKQWAEEQQKIQQDNTNFAIEKVEQQKDQANKDYIKEQSGAYVDWQKQSGKYGAQAEQMAQQGLTNTGFSESSQVSMYNTYQNRVATARDSYNNAVLNYNNAIKEAQLQNNAKLAEIAYQALQIQLEMSLQGFQYKNQLLIEQANKQQEIDNTYHDRYLAVLNQMNTENALAEEVRQYNESMALQREQLQEEIRQYEQNYALEVKKYDESIRQFNEEIARLKAKDAQEYKLEIQKLELQKKQLEQQKLQADREYQLALKEYNLAVQKANSSGSSRSSSGSRKSGSSLSSASITKSKSTGTNTKKGYAALNSLQLIQKAAKKALKNAATRK